jgi:phytoene dehydrogenase-like protein
MNEVRKIAVIGGGIAGLCAAVYARKCGYQVDLFEKNTAAGGLATSWKRGEYTFENCLHWLVGSSPASPLYSLWREIFDIDRLNFIYPETFVTVENERGERLDVPSRVDGLETKFLKRAPQDCAAIHDFASAIRRLEHFELPAAGAGWAGNWRTLLRDLPCLPVLRRLSNISGADYGKAFTDPLIRNFFGSGETSRVSVICLAMSLAWMGQRHAGYPIGGSGALISAIADEFRRLGGNLRLGTNVERILVERDTAVGLQLSNGETVGADWVISAGDRHRAVYDLLGANYPDRIRLGLEPFPSYVMVSFGVGRDLSKYPGFVIHVLDKPLAVDPLTTMSQVSFRLFHYDPTFAPPGKTAVTCFLPTSNFQYWAGLQRSDPAYYQSVTSGIAKSVAGVLGRVVAGAEAEIEITDVSTPATVISYTGNWRGSMEGWLPTPATGFRMTPNTLPGLRRFVMVGHWVMPGGGLPSGLMTARAAIQTICKQDHARFTPESMAAAHPRAA